MELSCRSDCCICMLSSCCCVAAHAKLSCRLCAGTAVLRSALGLPALHVGVLVGVPAGDNRKRLRWLCCLSRCCASCSFCCCFTVPSCSTAAAWS